jgi:hypothetical protein
MRGNKILQTFDIELGKVKVYQLKGRDVREIMRMSKDLSTTELPEITALRSTTVNDKELTMDMLDDMSAADYMAVLNAQSANFTPTIPAAI